MPYARHYVVNTFRRSGQVRTCFQLVRTSLQTADLFICAKAARALTADCLSSTFMMEDVEVLLLLSRLTKISPLNCDEGPLTVCQNVYLSTVSCRYHCRKLCLIANCTHLS